MNKAALMRKIAKTSGISCREAAVCIDSMISSVTDALANGERIELRGFGSFTVKTVAAKKTALANGTVIPAHGRIVFRPCQKLRESVWNKGRAQKV